MSADTIIRDRSEKKELRLNENYILKRQVVDEKGYHYIGSLGQAHDQDYYSIRECENMKRPVSQSEIEQRTNYAMCKAFHVDNLPVDPVTHKRFCPCIPVFFRDKST